GVLRRAEPRPRPLPPLPGVARPGEPRLHSGALRHPGWGRPRRTGRGGPPGREHTHRPPRLHRAAGPCLRVAGLAAPVTAALGAARPPPPGHAGVPPAAARVPATRG